MFISSAKFCMYFVKSDQVRLPLGFFCFSLKLSWPKNYIAQIFFKQISGLLFHNFIESNSKKCVKSQLKCLANISQNFISTELQVAMETASGQRVATSRLYSQCKQEPTVFYCHHTTMTVLQDHKEYLLVVLLNEKGKRLVEGITVGAEDILSGEAVKKKTKLSRIYHNIEALPILGEEVRRKVAKTL